MPFWVYILRCADGSYYTGHTDNLKRRIGEHHSGSISGCYTVKRRPLELVFRRIYRAGKTHWWPNGRSKAGAARRKKR